MKRQPPVDEVHRAFVTAGVDPESAEFPTVESVGAAGREYVRHMIEAGTLPALRSARAKVAGIRARWHAGQAAFWQGAVDEFEWQRPGFESCGEPFCSVHMHGDMPCPGVAS